MEECELIALVSAIACGISKCCSTDDISVLSPVFNQLGDSLATILAQRALKENNRNAEDKGRSSNNLSDSEKECHPDDLSSFNNNERYSDSNVKSDLDRKSELNNNNNNNENTIATEYKNYYINKSGIDYGNNSVNNSFSENLNFNNNKTDNIPGDEPSTHI